MLGFETSAEVSKSVQISGKLHFSQKLRYSRGSHFSQCFILSILPIVSSALKLGIVTDSAEFPWEAKSRKWAGVHASKRLKHGSTLSNIDSLFNSDGHTTSRADEFRSLKKNARTGRVNN